MEYNDTHLSFILEKIKDIKIALFKSEINSELTLPNNIVETLHADIEGNIYFFTSCKGSYATQIDKPFYAYLDYHKKHTDIHLRVSGKAEIVKEEGEVVGLSASQEVNSLVMVKMKIMQAEYFGKQAEQESWTQKVKTAFNEIFFPSEQSLNFV